MDDQEFSQKMARLHTFLAVQKANILIAHMKTEEQRMEDFMIGLTKLTRDTGIEIMGCGCCGSPNLESINDNDLDNERAGYGYINGRVAWISPNDQYDWENYADSIVIEKK